jgi:hypothetical protein
MNLTNDPEHWQGCKPPLSPNEEEVAIYKKEIGDKKPVYLFGMTKSLAGMCDVAVDLCPIEIGIPAIKSNWLDVEGFYAGAIIGDGIVNLEGDNLIKKVSTMTDKLIARVFMAKQPGMKYATYFPTEFPGSSSVIITQKDIAIVTWCFK